MKRQQTTDNREQRLKSKVEELRSVSIVIPAKAGIHSHLGSPQGFTIGLDPRLLRLRRICLGHERGDRKIFTLQSVAEWSKVVAWLLPHLRPGVILALSGPLGAGKTTFVQYLAKTLGIRKTPQSPTFSLLRTYRLPNSVHNITRLVHVDAYRIEDERDLLPLDLDAELRDKKTLLVIEWPERIPVWIRSHSVIRLAIDRIS